MRATR